MSKNKVLTFGPPPVTGQIPTFPDPTAADLLHAMRQAHDQQATAGMADQQTTGPHPHVSAGQQSEARGALTPLQQATQSNIAQAIQTPTSTALTTPTTAPLHQPSPKSHHPRLTMLTHLDLFSGIGGFSLAAERAGFTTIGFSEIDPYASRILQHHWPTVPNHGDIRNVPTVECDLITGGFPCQPYSLAGKRRGSADDRALWPEMCRVIARCRPTFILGENVPGIINMELDRVLDDLESLNYATRTLVIPACAVDAKHRRDRVWIVAHANGRLHERSSPQPNLRPIPRSNGQENGPLANTSSSGCEAQRTRKGGPEPRPVGRSGDETPANPNQTGRREQCRPVPIPPQYPTPQCGRETLPNSNESLRGRRSDVPIRQSQGRAPAGGNGGRLPESPIRRIPHGLPTGLDRPALWPAEDPKTPRIATGIPNRSHRLKTLGNAVVPQLAEALLHHIAALLR